MKISRDICVGRLVGMSVVCQINCVGGIKWIKHTHAQSEVLGRLKLTCDTRVIHFDYILDCFSVDEKETFT